MSGQKSLRVLNTIRTIKVTTEASL